MSDKSPIKILEKHWGYQSFRKSQLTIIESILSNTDTLALLPTGGGKSITYQVPAMVLDGICIVVSPLISLMQDQIAGLKKRGIQALSLNSAMSKKQIDSTLDNAVYGPYKFLFISPERIQSSLFIERLKKMKVSFVAVDEAHCISEWGYDFRPSYLEIASLRNWIDAPILALTATATKDVVQDIQDKLDLKNTCVIYGGFKRDNLSFNVLESNDKKNDLLQILKNHKGTEQPSIIYTKSRKETARIAHFLKQHSIPAKYYHAGLSQSLRKEIQDDWMQEKFYVIVATNAFGMGIDKPNVRLVIHTSLSDNPESYIQETGRAGRDKQPAKVFLMYNREDIQTTLFRFQQSHPSVDFVRKVHHQLCMHYQLAIGAGAGEEFNFDLNDFCRKNDFRFMKVYASLSILEMNQIIFMNESYHKPSTLSIKMERKSLDQFIALNPELGQTMLTILRSYSNLFTEKVKIKEAEIAKRSNTDFFEVRKKLISMQSLGIIDYTPSHDQATITFIGARENSNQVLLDVKSMRSRKKISESKLNTMINYVQNRNICRSVLLMNYFGERDLENCGICDTCLKGSAINYRFLDESKNLILKLISENSPNFEELHSINPASIHDHLDQDQIKSAIKFLLDEGSIHIKDGKLKAT